MKLVLDIKDEKVAFFLELLKNFSFVKKVTPVTDKKSRLKEEIKEAVEEVKLAKAGKKKLQSARDFLNEL